MADADLAAKTYFTIFMVLRFPGVANGCETIAFGATCQFLSIPFMTFGNDFPSWLVDDDNSTCGQSGMNHFRLKLAFESRLLYFEYIFKANLPSVYPEIYLENDREHSIVHCHLTEGNYEATGNVVLFRCASSMLTGFLSIVGPSVQDLCELHVSPGINTALKNNLRMYDLDVDVSVPVARSAHTCVDGNLESCIVLPSGRRRVRWILTFAKAMDINAILIHGTDRASWSSASGTIMTFNNTRMGQVVSVNKDEYADVLFLTHVEEEVTDLWFELFGGWSTVCEFEVYGALNPSCQDPTCFDPIACQSGSYGPDCGQMCSTNCKPSPIPVCNPINGDCLDCPRNKYGSTCENFCNNNCRDGACDSITGICLSGCEDNFNPPECEVCLQELYGSECEMACNRSCVDGACDRGTGLCLSGCEGHFTMPECTVCLPGFYGSGCEACSSNCVDGACDNETGLCLTGCEGHFAMPECTVCLPEFYGSGCEKICNNNCRDGACDNETGSCLTGCEGHFTMPECTVCPPEFYGSGCEKVCNSNCRNGTCDNVTGLCLSGCEGHFNPPECTGLPSRSFVSIQHLLQCRRMDHNCEVSDCSFL